MFRASLAKDSPHYSAFLTGDKGVAQQARRFPGYLSEISTNSALRPFDPVARFVKISKLDYSGSLNLLEIEVFNESGLNKALASSGATARMSSTYRWSEKLCHASLLIDGTVSGSACDGLAHSEHQKDPWIMIDLGTAVDIGQVKIYNRVDCCQDRLSGATVSLLDVNSKLIRQIENIGDTVGQNVIELNKSDFTVIASPGIYLRVTKVGNAMTAFYREAEPSTNAHSVPSFVVCVVSSLSI